MEKKETIQDSDSSDGLPDIPRTTFDIRKLKKNDIVWAEYKDLHWPALVRNVDTKSKKIRIWYCDAPKISFKVPFKKIHNFGDIEFNSVCYKKADSLPFYWKIIRRAQMFLLRISEGKVDDPAEFFDTSNNLYFVNKFLINACSEIQLSKNSSTEKVVEKNINLEESSEGESLDESDAESSTIPKLLPKAFKEDSLYDDKTVDKILSYILAGHVNAYLMDIVNSKISSERHELFVKAMKSNKLKQFWLSPPTVPINNSKLHNVSMYLLNFFKEKIGEGKLRTSEYVCSVWLPEAINKAISLIGAEPLKLPVDSTCNKLISSPISVEASKFLENSNIKKELKTKSDLLSPLVENINQNPDEIEACTSNKKKFTAKRILPPRKKKAIPRMAKPYSNRSGEIEASASNKKK